MIQKLLAACALLAAGTSLAAPTAELEPGAVPSAMTVRGAASPHYRIARGKSLGLSVTGPVSVRFEVRLEGAAPAKPIAGAAELDGKPQGHFSLKPLADPDARGERGGLVTHSAPVIVTVPAGRHLVRLPWPVAASGDALVAIQGIELIDRSLAELSPLPSLSPTSLAPLVPPPPEPTPPPPPPPSQTRVVAAFADQDRRPETVEATAVPAAAEKKGPWAIQLIAGAGHSRESYTGASSVGQVGFGAAYTVKPRIPVFASLDLRFSNQGYLSNRLAPDGSGLLGTTLGESRTDYSLGAGYDFGRDLLASGKLVLMPTLAIKIAVLANEAFPTSLLGLEIGARARFSLSPALSVFAQVGIAPNLLSARNNSALGPPKSDTAIAAGLSLPLGSGFALDAFYQSDLLAFEYDLRANHGGALALRASF